MRIQTADIFPWQFGGATAAVALLFLNTHPRDFDSPATAFLAATALGALLGGQWGIVSLLRRQQEYVADSAIAKLRRE